MRPPKRLEAPACRTGGSPLNDATWRAPASNPQPAVRLGVGSVRGIGEELAKEIEAERVSGGPYRDPEDLVRRIPALDLAQLEAMATGGLFGSASACHGEALWAVGAVAQSRPDRLAGVVTGAVSHRYQG